MTRALWVAGAALALVSCGTGARKCGDGCPSGTNCDQATML